VEIMALCASCYIKTEIPQIYNERIKNEIPPATNRFTNVKCRLCNEYAIIIERYER
jgi:hypothetical protein